jgi:hypothetical protein
VASRGGLEKFLTCVFTNSQGFGTLSLTNRTSQGSANRVDFGDWRASRESIHLFWLAVFLGAGWSFHGLPLGNKLRRQYRRSARCLWPRREAWTCDCDHLWNPSATGGGCLACFKCGLQTVPLAGCLGAAASTGMLSDKNPDLCRVSVKMDIMKAGLRRTRSKS